MQKSVKMLSIKSNNQKHRVSLCDVNEDSTCIALVGWGHCCTAHWPPQQIHMKCSCWIAAAAGAHTAAAPCHGDAERKTRAVSKNTMFWREIKEKQQTSSKSCAGFYSNQLLQWLNELVKLLFLHVFRCITIQQQCQTDIYLVYIILQQCTTGQYDLPQGCEEGKNVWHLQHTYRRAAVQWKKITRLLYRV